MLKDFEDFCNSGKAKDRMIESHRTLANQYYDTCMKIKDTIGTENEDYIRARFWFEFHAEKALDLLLNQLGFLVDHLADVYPEMQQKTLVEK